MIQDEIIDGSVRCILQWTSRSGERPGFMIVTMYLDHIIRLLRHLSVFPCLTDLFPLEYGAILVF